MLHDLGELGRVGRALSAALALLESERARLERHYGETPYGDCEAGGARQTLLGIRDLSRGVGDALRYVALGVGYVSLGLDERADHAVRMARMRPVGVPSGLDRMARPLGADTVRAMELVRDLGDFFAGDVALAVEVAFAAPRATYPPEDWASYGRRSVDPSD